MKYQPLINENDEIDLVAIFSLVWNNFWLLIICMFITGGIGAYYAYSRPDSYSATSKWLPQQAGASNSQLASIAGLVGMQLGGANASLEQFFPQIIKSPSLFREITHRRWPTAVGDSCSLLSLLRIDTTLLPPPPPQGTSDRIIESITSSFLVDNISYDASTTIPTLIVSTPDPVTSAAINLFIIQKLEFYIENNREQNSSADFEFFQAKYLEFQDSLRRAESRLLYFRQNNRLVNSPASLMEQQRLIRDAEMLGGLVAEFRKQLEMSRVNLTKKARKLQILEYPEPPLYISGPKRRLISVISGIFGLLLGSGLLLAINWILGFLQLHRKLHIAHEARNNVSESEHP